MKGASKAAAQQKALLIELTGKDDAKKSDVDLYSEIVASYQSQDLRGLRARVNTLVGSHPRSPFADNALYLAGRQSLDQKKYTDALRFFSRVTAEYPHSNRVVAAQFAKAMTYKKMNLESQARKVFREIIQHYPGSPESFRADSEIRLLN